MEGANQTEVTEFILMGFSASPELQWILFVMFLIIYLLNIATNTSIIVIVRSCPSLHCPMYVLLSNLSFLEIWYTSVTVPKLLAGLLPGNRSISVRGCIAQMFFFFSMGSTEFFLLAVMAYDRYLAICHPLCYSTIMCNILCLKLSVVAWVSGFLASSVLTVFMSRLSFCGPNKIDHFFCDFVPLAKLSCSDTHLSKLMCFTLTCTIAGTSFLLTTGSYSCVIRTAWRTPSEGGLQKALTTCGAHIAVTGIFYGSALSMYAHPPVMESSNMDKVVSLFYCVLTPLLNPIIYTLRNNMVKEALRKSVITSGLFRV
ncbi:olfactory receptor 6B1-like [Gopherus evgoodei]|uniref:olfactory receptor 6B1-like n=1 Tax=Gopherus evgoodei TaxID=1825980 RepID=UPI0011D01ACD|nr:olfactory receptor 6B1-like [Gopherus evgoodei]